MSTWYGILNQRANIDRLRTALASGKLAHAYLFHGPDGVGKCAVALELACTLQCDRKDNIACHTCTNCTKVHHMHHPDVHVLLPRSSDATPEELRARLETIAQNPYASQLTTRSTEKRKRGNRQAFYPVSFIKKRLHDALRLRPHGGCYHVVVMTQAETMREPAANAFLKLLEEPGPDTVLILTSSRPDLLLPTIRSRCQHMRFNALQEYEIADALMTRESVDPEQARVAARMADGSYTTALMLARTDGQHSERDLALDFLKYAYLRSPHNQMAIIGELTREGRDHVKSVLHYMLVWIRDLMLRYTLADKAKVTNIDKAGIITRFADSLRKTGADFATMARLVEEGRTLVGFEINLKILLVALFQSLSQAMRSSDVGKLYKPLA